MKYTLTKDQLWSLLSLHTDMIRTQFLYDTASLLTLSTQEMDTEAYKAAQVFNKAVQELEESDDE